MFNIKCFHGNELAVEAIATQHAVRFDEIVPAGPDLREAGEDGFDRELPVAVNDADVFSIAPDT